MRIPEGCTKQEVIDTLYNIANRLADRFKFSYHTKEDIIQTCVLLGIEGLERYKPDRPLENYLYVHCKNRLCTFKRDNYLRPASDKPCINRCPFNCYVRKRDFCKKYEGGGAGGSKMDCEVYSAWTNRNTTKQNVKDMLCFDRVKSDSENNMSYEVDFISSTYGRELLEQVEQQLPIEYLKYWQFLKNGIDIPKKARLALLEEIKKIVSGEVDGEGKVDDDGDDDNGGNA